MLPNDSKSKNYKPSGYRGKFNFFKRLVGDKDLPLLRSISISTASLGLLFLILFIPLFYLISHYGFWRHDDIPYLNSFVVKLSTEGRWTNYYLFEVIKAIPQPLAWWANFFSFFYFFYIAASRAFNNKSAGFLVSCICMASPSFYAQMNWPNTTLPAVLFLAACASFVRIIPYYIFLPVTSIIFFGIMPQFIYFLPLLFLERTFSDKRETAYWWAKFIVVWGMSFILGYIVANFMTWLELEETIQLASWRKPHQTTDLSGLIDNFSQNAWLLMKHFSDFFALKSAIVTFFIFLLVWSIFRPNKTQDWTLAIRTFIIGVTIAICHYIITAPAGIIVQHRTVCTLYIGVVFAYLALSYVANRRIVLLFALLVIALPAWYDSYKNVLWYSRTSSAMRENVRRSLPKPAHAYKGVIVNSQAFDGYYKQITKTLPLRHGRFFEKLDKPFRWQRALNEEGFTNIYLCPSGIGLKEQEMHPKCSELLIDHDTDSCDNDLRLICPVGVTKNNELILHLLP